VFDREQAFRLKSGMTKAEVEAILGPHSGQNVHHEKLQYAWIGDMMMLRVQFFGPNGTLSQAIFDTPEAEDTIVAASSLH
jgi:hypothetical protein